MKKFRFDIVTYENNKNILTISLLDDDFTPGNGMLHSIAMEFDNCESLKNSLNVGVDRLLEKCK